MNKTIIEKWTRILERLLLEKSAHVTDLLPGDDPKLEVALVDVNFRGILSLVDTSPEALSALTSFLEERSADYRVSAVQSNALFSELPSSDLVVGNHILDDLISFEFCRRNGFDYARMPVDVAYSRQVWDKICQDSNNGLYETPQVAFDNAARSLNRGGLIVLSSYASRFEREHGFAHETRLCSQLFRQLGEHARGLTYLADRTHFVDRLVSPNPEVQEQWLAFQKR
jgi:hypothetical protein|tara:strand:- start:9409 stop:10089 length:681 start_codon:yes stop_codon:yes gene_type:complete